MAMHISIVVPVTTMHHTVMIMGAANTHHSIKGTEPVVVEPHLSNMATIQKVNYIMIIIIMGFAIIIQKAIAQILRLWLRLYGKLSW
jgi:hypothetical protein